MNDLEPQIKKVEDLQFEKLAIPAYQRPYKWTAKNINQLITDLITFRDKESYRLGTLVLHNNKVNTDEVEDIVDGQQRIVTLTLLITKTYEWLKGDKRVETYEEVVDKIKTFSKK